MPEKKRELTYRDKAYIEQAKELDCPYQAKYVEMFGVEALNPAYWRGIRKNYESFYKDCVEEGHPWDWYFEFPDDAIF